MKQEKTIGWLLIAGAAGVMIPYTVLSILFDYPAILRQDAGMILTRFHEGGSRLIGVWFAFAILGLPLIPAYILIGQTLENKSSSVRIATAIGITGLMVQVIGLLRWTFVVPVIASNFVQAADEPTRAASIMAFKTIHQFGGVLLGEHLGQLFTIIWTVLLSRTLAKLNLVPKWVSLLGYTSSLIYLLAQADLFETVIPGFPVWKPSGLIGSTLWLIWLVITGIRFIKMKIS